jgi:hypothetical protein
LANWLESAGSCDVRRRQAGFSLEKTRDDSGLAFAPQIAGAVMDIAGPLFWAALVIVFLTGAPGIGLFR